MGSAAQQKTIEQTLKDLEIDTEIDPADAAKEVVSTTVVTTEGEEDEEGEDEEEDGKEEEAEDAPIPNVGVTTTRKKPAEKAASEEDDEEEEASAPHVAIPPPRPPKPKPKTRTPATNKIGKGLADKVPGAEKVQVYKRDKHGKKWFISEYTRADISNHTDFQSFLVEYVQDDHGPGEYVLIGIDAHAREMELGTVRLSGPKKKESDSPLTFAQQLIAAQQKRDEEYLKRMESLNKPQPQQDPLQLLMGVMDLQERVNGKADAAKQAASSEASMGMAAAFEALSSSGDKTMQMMMAMMQQQAQMAAQQTQLLVAAMQPKEDPFTKILMAKFLEDGGLGGGGGNMPPPPPPPPQGPNIVELITAIGGLMANLGGGGSEAPDDFKEFAKALLLKKEEEGLSTKDVIQILMAEKEKPGTDDFRSAVDNMAAIMNIAQNINRQNEGGPAAGLFDALAALFSNRDFAGSIAQSIRAKTDPNGNQRALAAQQQQLAMQQRLLAQQQAARQLPPQPQPQQHVAPQAYPEAPRQQPPPQQGAAQAADTQQAPAPSAARLPQLPAETAEHLNELANAKDDAELIQRLVIMLIYFAEFEEWRGFTEQVLAVTRDGDRKKTLGYLKAFFEGMAKIKLVDRELGARVLQAVKTHFDEIRAELQDLPLAKDDVITGDSLMAPPNEEEDEGEEGEEDEEEGEE